MNDSDMDPATHALIVPKEVYPYLGHAFFTTAVFFAIQTRLRNERSPYLPNRRFIDWRLLPKLHSMEIKICKRFPFEHVGLSEAPTKTLRRLSIDIYDNLDLILAGDSYLIRQLLTCHVQEVRVRFPYAIHSKKYLKQLIYIITRVMCMADCSQRSVRPTPYLTVFLEWVDMDIWNKICLPVLRKRSKLCGCVDWMISLEWSMHSYNGRVRDDDEEEDVNPLEENTVAWHHYELAPSRYRLPEQPLQKTCPCLVVLKLTD